jgi:peroxiredoxin
VLSAGAKAPGFTLTDLSGEKHTLADILERGPVLLALYKISCPVCQLTLPYLERIANTSRKNPGSLHPGSLHPGSLQPGSLQPGSLQPGSLHPGSLHPGSLHVIGVSQDDERGTHRFLKTYSLTMPTLLDREEDGYQTSNAFGITHVPSLFLVETDGTISLASNGFLKRDIETIGRRAGVELFHAEDHMPEWKAG